MAYRSEDSMGRDAGRANARKAGATGGEANRFQNETPGEKRSNAYNKKQALKKGLEAFKMRNAKNKDMPPMPSSKKK